MNDNIELIKQEFESFVTDITKFNEKGTAVAASRARKSLLNISKVTKELRKQIQERKKELKAAK